MGGEPLPITTLLQAAAAGDSGAARELLPAVYDQLRRLARANLAREQPGQTLQPTALVHEAYLRVVGEADPGWKGRAHFFGAAALAMRRILIERARQRLSLKHGDGKPRGDIEGVDVAVEIADEPPPDEVLAVAEATKELEEADPRQGQIVNLRYFVGLSVEQTAAAMGISVSTVEKEWRFIRAWLQARLRLESPSARIAGA